MCAGTNITPAGSSQVAAARIDEKSASLISPHKAVLIRARYSALSDRKSIRQAPTTCGSARNSDGIIALAMVACCMRAIAGVAGDCRKAEIYTIARSRSEEHTSELQSP